MIQDMKSFSRWGGGLTKVAWYVSLEASTCLATCTLPSCVSCREAQCLAVLRTEARIGAYVMSSVCRIGAEANAEEPSRGASRRERNTSGYVFPREVITRPQNETLGFLGIRL